MIDLWPLIGVAIITVGLALKLNTLLVILCAGVVTGLIADMPVLAILEALGESFTRNRYMSLFILVLPMIGLLERYGLRERAEHLIASIRKASAGRVMMVYLLFRQITNSFGLNIGGHPAMVRPLVAPMAEAAAAKDAKPLSKKQQQRLRALAAASENFGNFFSQLVFIAAGGLLLIKGVLEDNGYPVDLSVMYVWALPTALSSFLVFYVRATYEDRRIAKEQSSTEDEG